VPDPGERNYGAGLGATDGGAQPRQAKDGLTGDYVQEARYRLGRFHDGDVEDGGGGQDALSGEIFRQRAELLAS